MFGTFSGPFHFFNNVYCFISTSLHIEFGVSLAILEIHSCREEWETPSLFFVVGHLFPQFGLVLKYFFMSMHSKNFVERFVSMSAFIIVLFCKMCDLSMYTWSSSTQKMFIIFWSLLWSHFYWNLCCNILLLFTNIPWAT